MHTLTQGEKYHALWRSLLITWCIRVYTTAWYQCLEHRRCPSLCVDILSRSLLLIITLSGCLFEYFVFADPMSFLGTTPLLATAYHPQLNEPVEGFRGHREQLISPFTLLGISPQYKWFGLLLCIIGIRSNFDDAISLFRGRMILIIRQMLLRWQTLPNIHLAIFTIYSKGIWEVFVQGTG